MTTGGERPVRLHVLEHGEDEIVVTADQERLLRIDVAEALLLADEITVVAERMRRRTQRRMAA